MRLKQGQTWKCGDGYVRIVDLQRLEVGYKTLKSLDSPKSSTGTHQRTSKKDFCRMLKNAKLVTNGTDAGREPTSRSQVMDKTSEATGTSGARS